MKIEFSKSWIGSKQPRKQRKYLAKAPLHLRSDFMHAPLSKDLKKKYGKNALQIRKGDQVKVMRGAFKKKVGAVISVNLKKIRITVEGIQRTKKDGSKIFVALHPSKVMIIEIKSDDKFRIGEKNASKKT